jgi:hypothetical protein
MRILSAIEELQRLYEREGNIEITLTASSLPDGHSQSGGVIPDVYESTFENIKVLQADDKLPKRARLYF